MSETMQEKKSWYDKYWKILFIIPLIMTFLGIIYLGYFYYQHNDIIYKDVSLSGGTTITIQGNVPENLKSSLKEKFPDVNIRTLNDLSTGRLIATIIETSAQPENLKSETENILGYNLTEENSSIEFSGPALSQSFYLELIKIVFLAFILMALVIFLIFGESKQIKALALVLSISAVKLTFPVEIIRNISSTWLLLIIAPALIYAFTKSKTKKQIFYSALSSLAVLICFVFPFYYFIFLIALILLITYLINSLPSIAVIFAALSDIIFALVFVNIFEIRLSAAGIAAFLMLIGYSVDTDILLTSRALKKKEPSLNQRIFGAFKTGIFMTLTGLAAVLPAFLFLTGLPESFRQIFLILAVGLFADIINTWLTNAGIIKWYCQRRKLE